MLCPIEILGKGSKKVLGMICNGPTRLQRLLTLLETGSTQATRLTAARQIAKSHPQHLTSLLKKL
ncbi:hypothetical protein JHK82_052941 [Glycine max]|nr:hypothetical protein JHK86_052788 [Glycine max]KAG4915318.1 hypothetical protein JHK87_052875 [Glycine soja]KAG5082779.1 hypothetical protein JHK84_052817 [Glycine max]KAG5085544.1 hypothetical protein JHK82_052941 [Glycine max]